METKHFSQIKEVINETWAHYNNPAGLVTSTQFAASNVKKTGFASVKQRVMAIASKLRGWIFMQPKFSPELKAFHVNAGGHITDQAQALGGSNKFTNIFVDI